MKSYHTILTLAVVLISGTLMGQNPVPNSGFESWSGGQPEGWYVNNVAGANSLTQVNDAHSGSSAIKGEVVNFFGSGFAPIMWTGSVTEQFFPVTVRYARLTGYYKFNAAVTTDSLVIGVQVQDASQFTIGAQVIALGAASVFTQFTADIIYLENGTAARANISAVISGPEQGTPAIGSYFILDDLELSGTVTSINEPLGQSPVKFELLQNYPNPFNPATTFGFTIPNAEKVKLQIFNRLGQEVAVVADQRFPAGSHKIQWQAGFLPSGIYLYKLSAGAYQQSRRLLLLK